MRLSKQKIMLLLAERGMTVKQLAEALGMLPNNMSMLLSRGTCLAPTAGKIAKALSVPVRDVIEDVE